VQSGPSSHRAAGLWLATALPLTAERAVSAMGFEQEGMRGLKRGQNEEPNNKDDCISESGGAGRSTIRPR
jgi:hypothetical protein